MLLRIALAFKKLAEVVQMVRERRATVIVKVVVQTRGPALGFLDHLV